jgi:hypothetical protein
MKPIAFSETFDGSNLVVLVSNGERETRQNALSIDVKGAGPALALIAPLFAAVQPEMLAKGIE